MQCMEDQMGNFADLIMLALILIFFVACWGLIKFLDRI